MDIWHTKAYSNLNVVHMLCIDRDP